MITVTKHEFTKTNEGVMTHFYRLESSAISVDICDYGATILAIRTPDKNGKMEDVVLGYDTVQEYQNNASFVGGTIGRFANIIANGEFFIDGNKYSLEKNDNSKHHFNGGNEGFNRKIFTCEEIKDGVEMKYISPDMEGGYPGKLELSIKFILLSDGTLVIGYQAVSNKDTIINLTNNNYFNLKGHKNGDILDHKVTIDADKFIRVDSEYVPNGEIVTVADTDMDLRSRKLIGDYIAGETCDDIKLLTGYDHCYCLNNVDTTLRQVALVECEESGRNLIISTDLPGLQFYTGNGLTNSKGKDGASYNKHSGLTLETQFYPDSPNHTKFTTCALGAGEKFVTNTTFKFGLI